MCVEKDLTKVWRRVSYLKYSDTQQNFKAVAISRKVKSSPFIRIIFENIKIQFSSDGVGSLIEEALGMILFNSDPNRLIREKKNYLEFVSHVVIFFSKYLFVTV